MGTWALMMVVTPRVSIPLLRPRQRVNLDFAVSELPVPARLFLVPPVRFRGRLDGLAVRDARRLQRDVHAEPPLKLGDRHLDVQLTLAREQLFFGLRVAAVTDRR